MSGDNSNIVKLQLVPNVATLEALDELDASRRTRIFEGATANELIKNLLTDLNSDD